MALNPLYITAIDLCEYFVDKSTGQPLAGGIVSFWEDASRTTPKLVYELTGAPPNYTYTALPNPIILSNTGTFQDSSGNNIAVYYYPYDANGNVQLYYITVTDSLGVEQFTREAWPNIEESAEATQANISNQLTNPQFVQTLFTSPLTLTTSGTGTLSVTIAPDWVLNVTTVGVGTVTVTRNSITGSTAYPFNPPYTLTIAPGVNVTGLTLVQQLSNNPGIWSPQTGAADGWVAASILLAPLSSLTMSYVPSTGTSTVLLTANNLSGIYAESTATVQLPPSNNTESSDTGYVSIVLTLPTASTVTLSNVQVVTLESNLPDVVYEQTAVNRQNDQMFNYYNPFLQYKPIPSILIGWDFALNPAQFLGATIGSQNTGANSSYYIWDQTILYQSVTNSISVSRGSYATGGSLRITAAATTQFAIIQYLDAPEGINALVNLLSSVVVANTNQATLPGTISLWYTNSNSLPNVATGTNLSIVAGLDANGHPNAFNGTWVEVTRDIQQNATFTAIPGFNDFGFSGWNAIDVLMANNVKFIAIVIGFGTLTGGNSIEIDSVSLVPGNVPTIPGSQKYSTVISECQHYYSMSFPNGTVPAQNLGTGTGELIFPATVAGANKNVSQSVWLPSVMRTTPNMMGYSPGAATTQVYDETASAACTMTGLTNNTNRGFFVSTTANAGTSVGNSLGLHWTADARLGIV